MTLPGQPNANECLLINAVDVQHIFFASIHLFPRLYLRIHSLQPQTVRLINLQHNGALQPKVVVSLVVVVKVMFSHSYGKTVTSVLRRTVVCSAKKFGLGVDSEATDSNVGHRGVMPAASSTWLVLRRRSYESRDRLFLWLGRRGHHQAPGLLKCFFKPRFFRI